MTKTLKLREITHKDWEVLLEWRNDTVTRQNSFNADPIPISEHKEFVERTINNPNKRQFILEFNKEPVGTIRQDKLGEDEFELSYTISPRFRGQKVGQLLMGLYLLEQSGSFLCEVKEENIASIKMIERFGFRSFKEENGVIFFRLIKNN